MTGTIAEANPISFKVDKDDGSSFTVRRCTREEIEALPQTTANDPDDAQ